MPVNTCGTPTVAVFDGSLYFESKDASLHEGANNSASPVRAKANIFFILILF